MGIYSAARALDLSFVPITMERYDLVIPDRFFHEEKTQALLNVIHSKAFRRSVGELGGYDVSNMGAIIPLS
jgi:putative molybdopterin biosynthesis protein